MITDEEAKRIAWLDDVPDVEHEQLLAWVKGREPADVARLLGLSSGVRLCAMADGYGGFGVDHWPGRPRALVLYQCSTCGRLFADEQAIRAHQDHYQALHAIDSRVNEHDGEPWSTVTCNDGDLVGRGGSFAVFRGWADDGEIWTDRGYPAQRVRMSPAEFAERAVGLRDADQQAAICFVARAKAGGLDDDHDETCATTYLAKQWRRCQRLDPERFPLVAHQLHVLIALALGGAE